ncbi:MAG TPA: flagellar basal body rod C-terminal domain-containing protein [Candidatus Elarobacter sp.]|nr:flagellar basal body rod C-terminal domain-containing protein [Candidatus Elarobacter sp.]
MSELDILSIAAGGMDVQRTLLDVAARNVAAAQASTPEHPYPRLVARFASADPADAFLGVPDGDGENGENGDPFGARFAGTVRSGETADALTEMIAALDAQRAFEANASVFDAGKKLAERTLDVGRL